MVDSSSLINSEAEMEADNEEGQVVFFFPLNMSFLLLFVKKISSLFVCVFQVEDLSNEVFAQRHLALEQREKLRWPSWGNRKCCSRPKRYTHTNTVT